jgi:hypothetical protein
MNKAIIFIFIFIFIKIIFSQCNIEKRLIDIENNQDIFINETKNIELLMDTALSKLEDYSNILVDMIIRVIVLINIVNLIIIMGIIRGR